MRTEVGGTGGAASVAVMAAREEVGWTGGAASTKSGDGAGVMAPCVEVGWTGGASTSAGLMAADKVVAVI